MQKDKNEGKNKLNKSNWDKLESARKLKKETNNQKKNETIRGNIGMASENVYSFMIHQE